MPLTGGGDQRGICERDWCRRPGRPTGRDRGRHGVRALVLLNTFAWDLFESPWGPNCSDRIELCWMINQAAAGRWN